MPTQSTTYNSRLTSEALEKRFRDTFTSQGGAELVDDLYASGVIVPIVDFTAAAEGSALRADLQTAWDFGTDHDVVSNTTTALISTPGFWQIDLNFADDNPAVTIVETRGSIYLDTGITTQIIWSVSSIIGTGTSTETVIRNSEAKFVVYLRSGDTLRAFSRQHSTMDVWYRQIADVNGNLTNPTGFSFS